MIKTSVYATFLLGVYIVVVVGCSGETIKRTTYETLQNIREKECSKTPSVDCEKRESLEVYEDKKINYKTKGVGDK